MSKHVLGTAAAAVFATAMASAQTPAQSGSEQQRQQTGQHDQHRMMTLEGCLQQEQRAEGAAATVTDGTFVLRNAQVSSGAASGATADASPAQGERRAEAVGTSGIAGASYKIVGLADERLEPHAGQRVRLQGHLEGGKDGKDGDRHDASRSDTDAPRGETPATGAAKTDPAGTTGTGVAGHGASGTAQAGADSSPTGQGAMASGKMKEFRATSIERVSGDCPASPASR